MLFRTSLFLALIVSAVSCKQTDKKTTVSTNPSDNFIKPPVTGVDVPYQEFLVDAAKGDTIYYKTGSIVLFPPNAFVDKDGAVVGGNVQVRYREFADPIDFYLSGIPMHYDSAGVSYNFVSSGMCEVLAFKDGVPVFVNPKSKPEINLATNDGSEDHNLYYLDTIQKKWINKGTSIVTHVSTTESESLPKTMAIIDEPEAPLKPEKATNKSPVIKIIIDPSSFRELAIYNNLQFQLDVNEKNFNPDDTSNEWSAVQLLKGATEGLYTVKFTNPKKTVSYSARPVLEGKDYDEALLIFKQKQDAYIKAKAMRVAREMKAKGVSVIDSLAYVKMKNSNKKNEKLNALIKARNLEIEKQNEIVSEINTANNDFRTFTIDQFGVWNCDLPVRQNLITIKALFVDKSGGIVLNNIAVICKNVNSILRHNSNTISVVQDLDNMIVGAVDGAFAYISYEDFKNLGISENTKTQTFFMTVLSGKENTYKNIKAIAVGR